MLSFLVNLDQTVEERCEPEKPLQECRQHDSAHDGDIHDLQAISKPSATR